MGKSQGVPEAPVLQVQDRSEPAFTSVPTAPRAISDLEASPQGWAKVTGSACPGHAPGEKTTMQGSGTAGDPEDWVLGRGRLPTPLVSQPVLQAERGVRVNSRFRVGLRRDLLQ